MPHEFDYEAAKAIFHGSNLHEVRADGVWLLSENIAPILTSAERKAFIEHPLDSLWEMGKPSPSSQPVLRIPFTAADLAACFAVGAGALFAAERFGDSDEDLDETLEELDAAPAAKAAVRAAYAEFRKAVEFVGTLDALHEEDAQRKTAVSRQAARRVRKRLNIDDHLARVNAELEAELSAQQRELDENLALLEDGLAAKDEESIQKKTALHNCADLQEAKSRAAAFKKRNEILAPLDDWKAKSVGCRRRRDMAADAWEEAAEAEAAWRKKLVQQLLNSQQVPLPLSGSADDALPDVARAQPEAQAEHVKPVQRSQAQDAAILEAIRALGHEPKSLPRNQDGKPGVKAAVRADVTKRRPDLFQPRSQTFKKAWERLRRAGDVADKIT